MTMSQYAGVVVHAALSVVGVAYAPSLYNNSQVDYIASSKTSYIIFSQHLLMLLALTSGSITASNYYTDGVVNATTINASSVYTES